MGVPSRAQHSARRWGILAIGTAAQASSSSVGVGIAVLAPTIEREYSLTLADIGVVLASVNAGITLGLIPFGLLVDRIGERFVISIGMFGAGVCLLAAAKAPNYLSFLAALGATGVCSASVIASSGSVILSWFAASERGFASGVRLSGMPIGALMAAAILPPLASNWGVSGALIALSLPCLVAAFVSWFVMTKSSKPLRRSSDERRPFRDRRIWRLAGAGVLIFPSQTVVLSFVVLFLHQQRGLSTSVAAIVLAAAQLAGAVLRVASGKWSDRVGDRIKPLIQLSLLTAVAMLILATTLHGPVGVVVAGFILAGVLASGANGLLFVATAEVASRSRSGEALGLQQTIVGLSATGTPVLFAILVSSASWGLAFALFALLPLAAVLILRRKSSSLRPAAECTEMRPDF